MSIRGLVLEPVERMLHSLPRSSATMKTSLFLDCDMWSSFFKYLCLTVCGKQTVEGKVYAVFSKPPVALPSSLLFFVLPCFPSLFLFPSSMFVPSNDELNKHDLVSLCTKYYSVIIINNNKASSKKQSVYAVGTVSNVALTV